MGQNLTVPNKKLIQRVSAILFFKMDVSVDKVILCQSKWNELVYCVAPGW